MRITRVYTGDDNETHFEDIDLDVHPEKTHLLTDGIPTSEIIFRTTPADAFNDFHNPARRQYTINLEGTIELESGTGQKCVLGPGTVMLVEDLTGRGHISRGIAGNIRRSIVVGLD
ncbi:MAG: hypothetical protein HQ478_02210 [Chloroflexi bacterium]|nr:hypothetical protein [Chloroflexota bacterium]